MKETKRKKLHGIRERLLDVYLEEADPENWTNEESAKEEAQELLEAGAKPSEVMKVKTGWKGERYWEKKNANQTMAMLLNIERYLEATGAGGVAGGVEEADDEEIARFEREAKKRLARTRPRLVSGGKK